MTPPATHDPDGPDLPGLPRRHASTDASGPAPASAGLPLWQRRLLWVVGGLGVVAALVSLIGTMRSSSVPVGVAGGSMPGMVMPGDGADVVRLRLQDVERRRLDVPGGKPTLLVLAQARDCAFCLAAARAGAAAIGRTQAQLIVVFADAATGRDAARSFAASLDVPAARYVIDDRTGTLASSVGVRDLGGAAILDARGTVVDRVAEPTGSIEAVLARAR